MVLGTRASRCSSAIFIVEFAPDRDAPRARAGRCGCSRRCRRSIYGLIGILVLVPFVGNHLISRGTQGVGRLRRPARRLEPARRRVVILTVMITPIMIAIIVDALRAVPRGWTEGAAALGVNRWRAMWTISVRAARPAIVAAAVLATARALGEAIMLSMVSGSVGFAPNPLDGLTFFFEPARPLAATIVDNAEGLSVKPVRPDDLRLRGGAARLEPVPVARRLGRRKQPLQALRGERRDERRTRSRAAPAAPRRRRPRLEPRPGALATGSALGARAGRRASCSA